MQSTATNDLPSLLKESVDVSFRTDNLIPLLVDALIVFTVGTCTLGFLFPSLLHGYTTLCLRAVRGEKIAVGESFRGLDRFAHTLVLGLLVFLLFVLGTLLPLVGNLVVASITWWAFCASAERPWLGALDAIKTSYAFTRAHPLETILVVAIGLGLNALLAVTFLGTIATTAFSMVLTAVVWTRLTPRTV